MCEKSKSYSQINRLLNNELVSKVITSSFFKEPDVNNISTDWSNDNFNILDKESIPIEFGRGCIFKCKFCAYDLTGKKKGTYIRDLSQIRDELILTWEKYGTTNFYFILFNFITKFVKKSQK